MVDDEALERWQRRRRRGGWSVQMAQQRGVGHGHKANKAHLVQITRRDRVSPLYSTTMTQLSAGICARLSEASPDEIDELGSGYTVQLLSIKKVNQTTSAVASIDRYRIIISDGVHFVQAMLATQLNDLVARGDIVKNSIVVVDKLTCNFVQDKRSAFSSPSDDYANIFLDSSSSSIFTSYPEMKRKLEIQLLLQIQQPLPTWPPRPLKRRRA